MVIIKEQFIDSLPGDNNFMHYAMIFPTKVVTAWVWFNPKTGERMVNGWTRRTNVAVSNYIKETPHEAQ